LSLFLSYGGYKKRSLNLSGAISAVFVGFFTALASIRFAVVLVAFFLSSSILTKFKSSKKKIIEEDFKEGGQRNWEQVFANGGGGTVCALLYLYYGGGTEVCLDFHEHFLLSAIITAFIGHYACCNGDTWASELGVLSKGDPWLITTGRKIVKGTNGGVSPEGTLASIVGGTLIGLAFYVSNYLVGLSCAAHSYQWIAIPFGAATGFAGSLLDSLMGATLQYSGYCSSSKRVVSTPSVTTRHITGIHLLSNHQVNFFSALLTSFLSPILALMLFGY